MSGSFESVRWNACEHKQPQLYSHSKEFGGNGVRTHVNFKGKITSTGSEEDRTHNAASSRTASPTHYQQVIPLPPSSPPPLPHPQSVILQPDKGLGGVIQNIRQKCMKAKHTFSFGSQSAMSSHLEALCCHQVDTFQHTLQVDMAPVVRSTVRSVVEKAILLPETVHVSSIKS